MASTRCQNGCICSGKGAFSRRSAVLLLLGALSLLLVLCTFQEKALSADPNPGGNPPDPPVDETEEEKEKRLEREKRQQELKDETEEEKEKRLEKERLQQELEDEKKRQQELKDETPEEKEKRLERERKKEKEAKNGSISGGEDVAKKDSGGIVPFLVPATLCVLVPLILVALAVFVLFSRTKSSTKIDSFQKRR